MQTVEKKVRFRGIFVQFCGVPALPHMEPKIVMSQ